MYKQYRLFLSDGITTHTIVYNLEQTRPAQVWASIMSELDASSLRPGSNSWQGLVQNIDIKIDRICYLAAHLNDKLNLDIVTEWDARNPQEALNKLHIHFPELEKDEVNIEVRSILSEYNDLIHELEDAFRTTEKLVWMQLLPEGTAREPLNDDDFVLFKASRKFGELCLHYPHVGRHPLELVKSKDFDCPADQIVPQYEISAYHTLRFYEDPCTEEQYQHFLTLVYPISTIKDRYELSDPKLAYGFIPIGYIDDTYSKSELLDIIEHTHIIAGWEITT